MTETRILHWMSEYRWLSKSWLEFDWLMLSSFVFDLGNFHFLCFFCEVGTSITRYACIWNPGPIIPIKAQFLWPSAHFVRAYKKPGCPSNSADYSTIMSVGGALGQEEILLISTSVRSTLKLYKISSAFALKSAFRTLKHVQLFLSNAIRNAFDFLEKLLAILRRRYDNS